MISSISVNGYRSLQGFTLDFRQGLNVLVGPNAAGKSNIIGFFNFLRLLTESPLAEAVASAGGAASVFTKIGQEEYQRSLSANIFGVLPESGEEYRYEFRIELTQTKHQIYFSSQKLSIGLNEDGKFTESRSISVEAIVTSEEKLDISSTTKGFGDKQGYFDDEQINNLVHVVDINSDQSLALILRVLPIGDESIRVVRSDFLGTAIFNVIPSSVKAYEDTVRRPGIASDGSGVAASLRALQIGDLFFDNRRGGTVSDSEVRSAKVVLDRIIKTIKLAVPRIISITASSDPFAAQLQCDVEFEGINETSSICIPLAQVSDGTAKWIALIIALFTSRSGISLEEPENFLHPHMQREIIVLMRENCSADSFVLLTTHSETVLNAVRPNEVIVVDYENGRTKAGRAANAELLMQQINETGFGLGYYYLAQAIESEP